ncbi:MAG: hypothetical protein GY819_10490 [Planctomycetaceae bacterium]|nr:hypothetical protein [Planctomycetaceae bacterium]
MMYHCSFNRFILISLALLGLSVSSANANLMSGDSIFGVESITLDSESGLEWLDLTHTAGLSYNVVSGKLVDPAEDLFGWRYATLDEVADFWTSGGGFDPYDGGAGNWVEGVFGYWGPSFVDEEEAYFISADAGLAADTHLFGLLADYTNQQNVPDPFAVAILNDGEFGDAWSVYNMSSALVRVTVVPVPAAIWLFGTALIGLVGYGKRKSKVPV